MTARRRRWFQSRVNILNVILVTIAACGAIVMALALVTTFNGLIRHHGVTLNQPIPTAAATEPQSGIYTGTISQTRFYTFDKKSDLKAFKQAGYGKVTITKGHRLRIASDPASKKSVSITVTVDGGSTVSFDDEQSGSIDYDAANFFIDGWSQKNGTGTAAGSAKYQVWDLAPGKHTLTWQYFTDNTYNLPTDAYYIDNIKITKVFTAEYLKPYKS